MDMGRLGPGPKAAVTWFLGVSEGKFCLLCMETSIRMNDKRELEPKEKESQPDSTTHSHSDSNSDTQSNPDSDSNSDTQSNPDSDSNSDAESNPVKSNPSHLESDGGKQADKEVLGDKKFSSAQEARTDARTSNGRFNSVPGKRNTYVCATDGCKCVRKVRFNKKKADWSILTINPCTHTDMNSGKWTYLPPDVQEHLRRLLLDRHQTPTTALAELQRVHRAMKIVQDLTVVWVENFYHRRVKTKTPRTTVEGLKERLERLSRDPPDDPCRMFVLFEDIDDEGENFLVVFSTVELLKNARRGHGEDFFHLDGTFQVTKEGFECLVLGTGDMSHALLPLALCIGTAERIKVVGPFLEESKRWIDQLVFPGDEGWKPENSMSDQSSVLRGQIKEKIKSVKNLGDCFYHVKQALRDRFSVLGQHYDMVRADINALHRIPCPKAFARGKDKCLKR